MARIVMSDDGIRFDGRTKDQEPLGGAESVFAELAEALAARGHEVQAHNRCAAPLRWKGVTWLPLDQAPIPEVADLYLANRSNHLIRACPQAARCVFWIHNPAAYLLKLRYQWPLLRRRPMILFSGTYHRSTYPSWAAGGPRLSFRFGIAPMFLGAGERPPPPPRAVFLSNPLRSLDWLLDRWATRIAPACPTAELHIFAGAAVYGTAAKADRMAPVLARAAALADRGVVLRGPLPKAQLAEEIARARIFLYRGDIGETFCNAVAEPQAMGLPGVVEDIACMAERVVDGVTGFVVRGEQAFAEAALRLLLDDSLWLAQHRAALARQGDWSWDDAAAEVERLVGL